MNALHLAGLAYTLGSIPFGVIFARLQGTDIRSKGSGNIGATNALRTSGKLVGLSTLLCDIAKGYAAMHVGIRYNCANIACIAVLCGHMFPVWLKFSGGKGVATFLGILFAASGYVGTINLIAWGGFFVLTRISSLSSLLSVTTTHAMIWLWRVILPVDTWALFVGVLLIIAKHSSNIKRLLNGTELPASQNKT